MAAYHQARLSNRLYHIFHYAGYRDDHFLSTQVLD